MQRALHGYADHERQIRESSSLNDLRCLDSHPSLLQFGRYQPNRAWGQQIDGERADLELSVRPVPRASPRMYR